MDRAEGKKSTTTVYVILVFSLLVSTVFLLAWQMSKKTKADTLCQATITRIEKVDSPNKEDGIRYDISAEYVVDEKKYYIQEGYLTSSGEKIGDTIDILYNSENPEEYYLGSNPDRDETVFCWLFVISLVFPILLIVFKKGAD